MPSRSSAGDNEREIVEHPGAVTIVAVDREDRVALVRQFREATRQHLLELPAGTLEPGEEPLAAAQRELEEEAGLTGGEWREVTRFWTVPGFCRELMTLYFARASRPVKPGGGGRGAGARVLAGSREIEQRLGEIEDAKSLTGLLLYLKLRAR